MNGSAKDRIRSSPHYGAKASRIPIAPRRLLAARYGIHAWPQGPVGVMVLNRVSGSISESEMGSDAPPGSENVIVRQVVFRS